MVISMRASGLAFLVVLLVAGADSAFGQAGQPLTEQNLTNLIELQIDDQAIAAKLEKAGVAFPVDQATVARLKNAGASDAVIAAARAAGSAGKTTAALDAITYRDVLKLLQVGLREKDILRRLEKSPTSFTLDAAQVAALKRPAPPRVCCRRCSEGAWCPRPAARK